MENEISAEQLTADDKISQQNANFVPKKQDYVDVLQGKGLTDAQIDGMASIAVLLDKLRNHG